MYSVVAGRDCQKFNNLLKRLRKFSFKNKNKLLDGKRLIIKLSRLTGIVSAKQKTKNKWKFKNFRKRRRIQKLCSSF